MDDAIFGSTGNRVLMGLLMPALLEPLMLGILGRVQQQQPAVDVAPIAAIVSLAVSAMGFFVLTQRFSLRSKILCALGYFPFMSIVFWFEALTIGGAI